MRTAGFQDVAPDLREVTFADSTAIRLILEFTDRAAGEAWSFRVAPVQRVFEVSGIQERLDLVRPRG